MASRYKCPNCAGSYEYDPKSKGLKCTKCGAVEYIKNTSEIKSHLYGENVSKYNNDWAKKVRQVKCRECGAQVVLNSFDIVSKCSYCDSTNIVDIKEVGIAPDAVLPFEIDKVQAKEHFKNEIKKKFFIPNILKKKLPTLKVNPNYIGSYIFNGSVIVKYWGQVEYEEDIVGSDGVSKSIVRTKNVSGEINQNFNDYIVECSDNLSQAELLDILPYDLKNQKAYKGEYLLGATADYANKSLEQANRNLENSIKNDVERKIKSKYDADNIRNMNYQYNYLDKKYVYCLMPTYLFCYDYKKKHYNTIMNGQTGKLGGSVPRSNVKITFFVLFILALFAGLLSLIII